MVGVGQAQGPGDRPAPNPRATRSVVIARNGIIATSQPLASAAGLHVLQSGGNAIDAAVTAAATAGTTSSFTFSTAGSTLGAAHSLAASTLGAAQSRVVSAYRTAVSRASEATGETFLFAVRALRRVCLRRVLVGDTTYLRST